MLNSFKTIVAECNYGQPIDGVQYGGHNIVKNFKLEPVSIVKNNFFKGFDGYYILKNEIERIHNECRRTLLLGGDHSIGISSVDAMLNIYGDDLRILWIDAHADINDYISSKTGNIHGMPLGFHFVGTRNTISWNERQRRLKPNQLFYYGIRDLDDFEYDLIKMYNIKHTNTINEELITFIKTAPRLMISFDVDSLDPLYVSSTGTRASGGLTPDNVRDIMLLASKFNLVHLDITELNPQLGDIDNSIDNIKDIFL
jgi:arginase